MTASKVILHYVQSINEAFIYKNKAFVYKNKSCIYKNEGFVYSLYSIPDKFSTECRQVSY